VRNPPDDHSLAVWIWPRALPLAEIFGTAWDGGEIRARFLTLTGQWQARHPALSNGLVAAADGTQRPGQWMWHPPAHRVYDCHTYEGPEDDWLEVTIQMEATGYSLAHCQIGATLTVACRCDGAHDRHTIVEMHRRSGAPAAGLDALTAVLRCTDQWLAGSRRPDWWRRHAGLG
jgi:hypothetical protein